MNLNSTFNELIEKESTNQSREFSRVLNLLLDAERDWRTPCLTVLELIENVERFIGGNITKNKLESSLDNLAPHILDAAWEVESITSLLEILQSYPDKDLRAVIHEL